MSGVVKKVMLVGRATTFMVGLALILALVVGAASAAFGANGANFILGQLNKATAKTQLNGNVSGGPALQVNNTKAEAGSRALQLGVAQGKPPIVVNATAGKATNLNADKIDGQDASAFMPASTYRVDKPITVDVVFSTAVLCDPGDLALSGAWANKDATTEITTATPSIANPGAVIFLINSDSPLLEDMTLIAVCADLPPLR